MTLSQSFWSGSHLLKGHYTSKNQHDNAIYTTNTVEIEHWPFGESRPNHLRLSTLGLAANERNHYRRLLGQTSDSRILISNLNVVCIHDSFSHYADSPRINLPFGKGEPSLRIQSRKVDLFSRSRFAFLLTQAFY